MRNYLVIWCLSSSLTHDFLSLKADLLVDDLSAPSEPVVAVPGGHKTNEDLLAEIFGGSTATSSPATPTPASQPQKSTANDILSLFDSPAPSAPPQAARTTTTTSSLFDLASSVTPSAPPPKPTAAAPKLPSYTAYDKNDLVISLTPQRSTTQPGVVDILARFQVKGNAVATNLNFQVAVPKVSTATSCLRRGSLTVVLFLSDFYYYYCHRRNSCKCSPCRVRTSTLGRQRRSKCASPRRWV